MPRGLACGSRPRPAGGGWAPVPAFPSFGRQSGVPGDGGIRRPPGTAPYDPAESPGTWGRRHRDRDVDRHRAWKTASAGSKRISCPVSGVTACDGVVRRCPRSSHRWAGRPGTPRFAAYGIGTSGVYKSRTRRRVIIAPPSGERRTSRISEGSVWQFEAVRDSPVVVRKGPTGRLRTGTESAVPFVFHR